MNLKINLKTISHKRHRYPTLGDYLWKITKRGWVFTVVASRELGLDSAFLVLFHELVEMFLCFRHGVTEKEIYEWDLAHPDADEPGEVKGAPYFHEHIAAIKMERYMAELLGVNWKEHEERCTRVFDGKPF